MPRSTLRSVVASVALASLAAAAPAHAQNPGASAPAGMPSPAPSPAAIAPGTARLTTTGMVDVTDLVVPVVAGTVAPTDAGGFDLRFQDESRNTLLVTLTVVDGQVTDAFVGVGVPGSSIFDATYFADFIHTQCTVDIASMDAAGVVGRLTCDELGNGADTGTIDVSAEFHSGPLQTASPAPSASPTI